MNTIRTSLQALTDSLLQNQFTHTNFSPKMRATNFLLALMASATVAIAAPASEAGTHTLSTRWGDCPNGWKWCEV